MLFRSLPADGNNNSWLDVNTTKKGSNDYDSTCLGEYDEGRENIYRLVVTEPLCNVWIAMAAWKGEDHDYEGVEGVEGEGFDCWGKPFRYAGITLDDACPPGLSCLNQSVDSDSDGWNFIEVGNLDPGTYYIMVDNKLCGDEVKDQIGRAHV